MAWERPYGMEFDPFDKLAPGVDKKLIDIAWGVAGCVRITHLDAAGLTLSHGAPGQTVIFNHGGLIPDQMQGKQEPVAVVDELGI
mgnify:CR=1 FL=1